MTNATAPTAPPVHDSEEWRPIPEWPYEASNLGRVRRIGSTKALKPVCNGHGYDKVTLWNQGKSCGRSIHRLVVIAWRGPIAPGLEVNHKDGQKRNNALQNLEIVTPAENLAHAMASGLQPIARSNAKLTPEMVLAIRLDPRSEPQIAAAYGISKSHTHRIKVGEKWRHLEDVPRQREALERIQAILKAHYPRGVNAMLNEVHDLIDGALKSQSPGRREE